MKAVDHQLSTLNFCMRYICPKCGETFAVKPPSGTCVNCDAALLPESETQAGEPRGEREGLPSPKRRL